MGDPARLNVRGWKVAVSPSHPWETSLVEEAEDGGPRLWRQSRRREDTDTEHALWWHGLVIRLIRPPEIGRRACSHPALPIGLVSSNGSSYVPAAEAQS